MGLDLGRPALTHGRGLVAGGVVIAALLPVLVLLPAASSAAQDPTPAPGPTQGVTVAPPTQQQIDDARSALDRLRQPARTPTTTIAQVAGPVGPKTGSVRWQVGDQAWWTLGAALLVLLVLSETTRISVRRAKHRKGA